MALKDLRPYLLNAHIQWLDDSGEVPHVVIRNGQGVQFPPHLRTAEILAFNVSSEAVKNLSIDESGISFDARFGGKTATVYAPLNAIKKMHNREGTIGMNIEPVPDVDGPDEDHRVEQKPTLKVIETGAPMQSSQPRGQLRDVSTESKPTEPEPPRKSGLTLVPKD